MSATAVLVDVLRKGRAVLAGLCAAVLVAVPLAACDRAPSSTPPSATAPQSVPSADQPVRVELVRSGGMAGRTETVTVDEKGAWTYTAAGRSERGSLPQDTARALWRLVNDPKLAAELKAAGSPPSCSDGFGYELVVGDDRRLQAVDCGTLPATLKSVVTLIAEATPLG
ncbi:MAG: hypothetical protein ACRDT6_15600 [Micromonosporaceae bacterium]